MNSQRNVDFSVSALIRLDSEMLPVLLPSAQFEAVDCSLSKENVSTSSRQQQQQTLRQRNWSHKTLVSTSPSTSTSSSFPSSPILKLSPLTSSSYPTLKLAPLSPSSSPTKLSPPSPTSTLASLDGETAKLDSSLPLEKQR